MAANKTIESVLGFNVDLVDMHGAISKAFEMQDNGDNVHIVTINPEIIEHALKYYEFERILKEADITVADGFGIQLALRLKGIKQKKVPGVVLGIELLKQAALRNMKVAMLGARSEVVLKAKENLEKQISNINIVYLRDGYFSSNQEAQIIDDIKNSGAKLVLIALGAPNQDIMIDKMKKKMLSTIFIGLGGSFDVYSGVVKRAPEIWQRMNLEWLYRLFKEPKRVKRLFPTLPIFCFKVIIDSMKKGKRI